MDELSNDELSYDDEGMLQPLSFDVLLVQYAHKKAYLYVGR